MLELNCLVLGDTEQHIFTVETEPTKTVGTLKKLIKEENKHAFQHIDAKTLVLWKVSKPYDEIKNLKDQDLPPSESLIPVKRLSTLFQDHVTGENVDIIIKTPEPGK